MEKKTCTNCNEEKELSEFSKNDYGKGGVYSICKYCMKKINSKKYIKMKNDGVKFPSYKDFSNERKKERLEYMKKYRKSKKVKDARNKHRRKRHKEDSLYNLTSRIRRRTLRAFKSKKWIKNSSNLSMLGCDFKTAHKHIEKQFTEGMSWDNRSEWHIDHIIPLASAKTEEELAKLCHYTNLQPLWAEDNLRKGDKLNYKIQKNSEGL